MKRWMKQWTTYLLLGVMLLPAAWAEMGDAVLQPVPPAIATQLYNPQGNTIAGNPKGTVTLVEFFDYNCPFCRSLNPTIQKLIKKNPNLRVVYKEYLLFGDASIPATSAALAAAQQNKYLQMHQALLTSKHPLTTAEVLNIAQSIGLDVQAFQKVMNSKAVQQQVVSNTALAAKLNMGAAPAFIITRTQTAGQPSNANPQYLFLGSNNAEKNLQALINKAAKG
ncbi:MAG TPA: DsbA family protein [Gammaproteobacteria bacterium]|nr:DsbA family protein [Gammaproteobacteria bacterium]